MTNEFVNFKIAKKLNDIGFECKHPFAMYNEFGIFHALFTSADYYNCESGKKYREYYAIEDFDEHDYICPTISQVLKWLRKKGWYIEITYKTLLPTLKGEWTIVVKPIRGIGKRVIKKGCESWEEASVAGIEYVIDNLI